MRRSLTALVRQWDPSGLPTPAKIGAVAAVLLYLLALSGTLSPLTSMGGDRGNDYIQLARCGLSVRSGTNMFSSMTDFAWYGQVGSPWLSHPALCVLAGTPLSYLSPGAGYDLWRFLQMLLHVWVIMAFGRRLVGPSRPRDFVAFLALGVFFPWYVFYLVGHHQVVTILGLALVLLTAERRVLGTVLGVLSKPVLAPIVPVLVAHGKIGEAKRICLWVAGLTLPFALFGYTPQTGLRLGGSLVHSYLTTGTDAMRYVVPDWDQSMSLAFAFEQLAPRLPSYGVRVVLTLALLAYAVFRLRRAPLLVACAFSSLWYFVMYARGHEYHLTLLLPVLAFLWTEPRGLYRTRWMAALITLLAVPTTWAIFVFHYGVPGYHGTPGLPVRDLEGMRADNLVLFILHVAMKPACELLLIATVVVIEERAMRRGAPQPAPAVEADPAPPPDVLPAGAIVPHPV